MFRWVTSLLAALLLAAPAGANSLILDATSKSLELETGSAASTDYVVAYTDNTTTTFTPGMNQGNVAAATTTTILAAPAASTQRQVKWVSVRNRSTTAVQTATLKLDVSATEFHISPAVVLAAGETLRVDANGVPTIFTTGGVVRTQATDVSGYSGRVFSFFKTGTASEAVAREYWFAKDAGFPGAWVPGTPGLNGTAVECDTSTEATIIGSPIIPDPAAGGLYLTQLGISTTTAHLDQLMDVIWYNTGIVVATTTAQAITQPALGARDATGTTNGEDWGVGLYTTVTGTAGAIANTTLQYTDSQGNAGATGTMSWPATAVAGTFVPFSLAAGDTGIRSIQSITLGTAHTTEVLNLIHYRQLASVPNILANAGSANQVNNVFPGPPGVRLWNDTCLHWRYNSVATTATSVTGTVNVMER